MGTVSALGLQALSEEEMRTRGLGVQCVVAAPRMLVLGPRLSGAEHESPPDLSSTDGTLLLAHVAIT